MIFKRRRQLLIDKHVQGAIACRFVVYWAYYLITLLLWLFFWRVFAEPDVAPHEHLMSILSTHAHMIVVSLLLLPLVVYDVLKLTNGFAGPIYRLRKALQSLGSGEAVAPLKFRTADSWQELADAFNQILERMPVAEPDCQANELEETCAN